MEQSASVSHRQQAVDGLLDQLGDLPSLQEGDHDALAMLVLDAALAGDAPALRTAHEGVRWLYGRDVDSGATRSEQAAEGRGRLLGLLDVVRWALRRSPDSAAGSLSRTGHAARFLAIVGSAPGVTGREVGRGLGVDETEVSRLGRRLLTAGLVRQERHGKWKSWHVTPRGQAALEALDMAPTSMQDGISLGVAVGPQEIVGVAVDTSDTVLALSCAELPDRSDPDRALRRVSTVISELLNQLPKAGGELGGNPTLLGAGLEIGGHVDAASGDVVYAPNYAGEGLGWHNFPLERIASKYLRMRVVVENDANCLAAHELHYGVGQEVDDFAVVLLSDGIGCGVVVDRKLVHGERGAAGELGHLVVEPGGRVCTCGNPGCLETVAGLGNLCDIARELRGDLDLQSPLSIDELVRLAEDKSNGVWPALERAGTALGRSLSALLNLLNPSVLVIYGPAELVVRGSSTAADLFMEALQRELTQQAFSTTSHDCALRARALTSEVLARAAAATLLLTNGHPSPARQRAFQP